MAEVTAVDAQLDRLEKMLGDLGTSLDAVNKSQRAHLSDGDDVLSWFEDDPHARPIHFDSARKTARPRQRFPKGYKPFSVWKSAGDFYADVITSARERSNTVATKLDTVFKSVQGMQTGILSDGGALVVPEFASGILDRVYNNDLWSTTDSYTVSSNSMVFTALDQSSRANGQRAGGLQHYWVEEGGDNTKSKPKTRRVELRLKKVSCLVYLTEEMLSDSAYALEQFVTRKVGEEFAFALGNAYLNGVGAGMPLGVLASNAFVTVPKESGQAAATLVYENINNMWSRLHAGSMPNAKWYINQDVYPQLNLLSVPVGTAGQPVFQPPGGASASPYGTLLGRPIVVTEFNETLGTVGDIVLGDPAQYLTISKGGVTQATSMHVEFLTDQVAMKFTMRVDGRPWDDSVLTPYKGSNTVGSFVALATRD